jgi:hypothetical protein
MKAESFEKIVNHALADRQLQVALDRGTTRGVNARLLAMSETTDAQGGNRAQPCAGAGGD